jgi:hypothetical protein
MRAPPPPPWRPAAASSTAAAATTRGTRKLALRPGARLDVSSTERRLRKTASDSMASVSAAAAARRRAAAALAGRPAVAGRVSPPQRAPAANRRAVCCGPSHGPARAVRRRLASTVVQPLPHQHQLSAPAGERDGVQGSEAQPADSERSGSSPAGSCQLVPWQPRQGLRRAPRLEGERQACRHQPTLLWLLRAGRRSSSARAAAKRCQRRQLTASRARACGQSTAAAGRSRDVASTRCTTSAQGRRRVANGLAAATLRQAAAELLAALATALCALLAASSHAGEQGPTCTPHTCSSASRPPPPALRVRAH